MAMASTFKELKVWQNAMDLAMKVFEASKSFPPEERYSLTDQIRKSSRSTAACIAEGWRKRRYVAAFASKLNEAESETAETQTWIEFARRCGYWDIAFADELEARCEEVLAQLASMIRDANRWCSGFQRA